MHWRLPGEDSEMRRFGILVAPVLAVGAQAAEPYLFDLLRQRPYRASWAVPAQVALRCERSDLVKPRVRRRWRVLHSSAEENLGQYTGAEQAPRGFENVNNAIELVRHSGAAECRSVHTVHIPLQQLEPHRSLLRQLREPIILERCTTPGGIDHRLNRAEPTLGEGRVDPARIPSAGQRSIQAIRLDGAHGHALAVDRVEAAHRIAQNNQAFREARELLVVPPQAACEAMVHNVRQGFEIADDVIKLERRQRARKGNEGVRVLRCGFVEATDERDKPSAALNRKQDAASLAGRAGNEQRLIVRPVIGPVERAAGVCNRSSEQLGLRGREAQLRKMLRRGAASAGCVDHQIGINLLVGPMFARHADAYAPDRAVRVALQRFGPKAVEDSDVAPGPYPLADAGFE